MLAENDVRTWPSIRDVAFEARLSQARILQLIHNGTLHAALTRLGWLVNPESAAAWLAQREARKAQVKR